MKKNIIPIINMVSLIIVIVAVLYQHFEKGGVKVSGWGMLVILISVNLTHINHWKEYFSQNTKCVTLEKNQWAENKYLTIYALDFNKTGGRGCISVTANVAARLCSEMHNASLTKDNIDLQQRAEEINKILTPLNKSLFIESNPSPVKYAASLLNLSLDDVRLPLVKITDSTKLSIKQALEFANLI